MPTCDHCNREFLTPGARRQHLRAKSGKDGHPVAKMPRRREVPDVAPTGGPNWVVPCSVCGCSPTVEGLGLCGPCCFGKASTAGGNW